MPRFNSPRRKVFISFHGTDELEVLDFVQWAESIGVMIPRMLHAAHNGDVVNSSNPEYVMSVIRNDYLQDTTVTLLLLGTCTHSRRYVDWELKSSLRQGSTYIPNGLLAMSLPGVPARLHLPARFRDNWQDEIGYARWYPYTRNADELAAWIDEAYAARSSRPHLISNGREMMRHNGQCNHCRYTHPAG